MKLWIRTLGAGSLALIGMLAMTACESETSIKTSADSTTRATSGLVNQLISFSVTTYARGLQPPYFPAASDLNGDGCVDVLGGINDGTGRLLYRSADQMGLGKLFDGRAARDNRIADFNNDGIPDLVANTYSPVDTAAPGALLFDGVGDGSFIENSAFTALNIQGYGETIIVADFDNDGDLDIYIPYYSHNAPNEQSYLLENLGGGAWIDIADSAGVALRDRPEGLKPEGAHAVDFNLDGWIDFYVSGHLFINNGNRTFTDHREDFGLPERFDEGVKFIDWNNDGDLDLILHDPSSGPMLYDWNGQTFTPSNAVSSHSYFQSYGLNTYDINNDGYEDIFPASGKSCKTPILLNNKGKYFAELYIDAIGGWCSGSLSFADFNDDGMIDLLTLFGGLTIAINTSKIAGGGTITIDVRDANGLRTEQGRIVHVVPVEHPTTVYTRIVDGGAGYLSQTDYLIHVGTPYVGEHQVTVYYPDGQVKFLAQAGKKYRTMPGSPPQEETSTCKPMP